MSWKASRDDVVSEGDKLVQSQQANIICKCLMIVVCQKDKIMRNRTLAIDSS